MKLFHVRSLEWEAVYLKGILQKDGFQINLFPWRDLERVEKWVDEAEFGGSYPELLVDVVFE